MSDSLIETAQAFETIKKAMQDDKPGDSGSYAHSWHCNIAMACYDAISSKMYDDPAGFDSGRAHEIGNLAASRFMKLCFDVETKGDASECGKEKPAARNYDEKREIRKLKPDEKMSLGDLVTVAEDDSKGYRPLQGLVDILAGEYSYPIYRNDNVGVGCDRDFVDAKNHIKSLKIALERIAKWEELDIKTRVDIGSNGVRNYYRKISIEALESQRGEFFEGGEG